MDYMQARMIDPDYSILSSEDTTAQSWQTIWTEFVVVTDLDGNGVYDNWELLLAQKFCPSLFLHSGDQDVRPVPVESMDRNGDGVLGWEDVLVTTYPLGSDTPIEYQLDKIYIISGETYLTNIKYPHFRNILPLI